MGNTEPGRAVLQRPTATLLREPLQDFIFNLHVPGEIIFAGLHDGACGGDRIAAALYVDGLADYQRGFQAMLAEHGDARSGVEAIVAYHLQWVDEHADLARFLLAMRETEVIAAAAPELHRRNRAFFAAVHAWFARHAELPDLPADLLEPLLLGPTQEFVRHWLAGRATTPPARAQAVLAAAAWHALTTTEEAP